MRSLLVSSPKQLTNVSTSTGSPCAMQSRSGRDFAQHLEVSAAEEFARQWRRHEAVGVVDF
jgi:hypothetical protein